MSENRCCCKKNLLDNDLEQVEKIKKIIDKIYEPQLGARPIERYIFDEIEPMLINKILNK